MYKIRLSTLISMGSHLKSLIGVGVTEAIWYCHSCNFCSKTVVDYMLLLIDFNDISTCL